ncbi:MAG: L-histidine N(alpha)-methyltransferase [bacterium]
MSEKNRIRLIDHEPSSASFLEEVLAGLGKPQKTLPCKFFYDERGSALFDRICGLEEYYLTRTEIAIMREFAPEMAGAIGPGCVLVEYGIGSALKTRYLLEHLESPAALVPVDISREHLLRSAAGLAEEFPGVEILPVCANFTEPFGLPPVEKSGARAVAYFPGSTIGNMTPEEAGALLGNMAATCGTSGAGGGLLVGIDLIKDVAVLEAAYNDSEGVTAEFNKNILVRMNRELGADFDVERFEHRAVYNPDPRRIESYLVSRVAQRVRVGDEEFAFEAGEAIHTENSHKYDTGDFADFASGFGFRREKVWTDNRRMFAVMFLSIE